MVAKIIRNARLNLAERKVNNCSAKFALGFFEIGETTRMARYERQHL